MKIIEAIFSQGIIKPLEKLKYPEGKKLKVAIEDEKGLSDKDFFEMVEKIREHNKNVDPEILEKEIEEAIQEVRKSKAEEKEWQELSTYGSMMAEKQGLKEDDINRIVKEYRSKESYAKSSS